MQAALNHFPADEAGEDAKAAEEDAEPHIVELDDACQHVRVVIEIKRRVRSDQEVDEDDAGRDKREEVDPPCAPGEQVAADFDTHETAGLQPPQIPRLLL